MKLRQLGQAPEAVLNTFSAGEIGLDRAYLLTQLAETGLTETELGVRSTDYSLGKLYAEWTERRRIDQETSQEQFDNRYLIIQPNLDNSVHRFWGQAIGTDGEAILKAIGKRETELPVLEDETRGQRQLDALASICLDSLTGSGAEGRAVTVAEIIIDGRLAAETNGEAGVTLATGPKSRTGNVRRDPLWRSRQDHQPGGTLRLIQRPGRMHPPGDQTPRPQPGRTPMRNRRLRKPIPAPTPPHPPQKPRRHPPPRQPHHPLLVPPSHRHPRPRNATRPRLTHPPETTPLAWSRDQRTARSCFGLRQSLRTD